MAVLKKKKIKVNEIFMFSLLKNIKEINYNQSSLKIYIFLKFLNRDKQINEFE